MSQGNQPIRRIRIGSIGAAIFENRTEEGKTYFNVQFNKSYRSGDDWKHTRSFGRDDLLALSKLADQAHTWIVFQFQSEALEDASEGEE